MWKLYFVPGEGTPQVRGGVLPFSCCAGLGKLEIVGVVEVFGDEAADADEAEVVEEGADLLGGLVDSSVYWSSRARSICLRRSR